MQMTETRAKLATDAHALSRIEMLLLQYPQVTTAEREEIGSYLRRATVMDLGLLSTNEQAWSKAERYRREHPDVFATTAWEYAVWAFLALAFLTTVALLWDGGLGR